MSEGIKYVASHFLAMFCRRDKVPDSDSVHKQFVANAGMEPEVSVVTDSTFVHLWVSRMDDVVQDGQQEVTLLLHGEVFDSGGVCSARSVLDQYLTSGIDFAKGLNGSFAVLIFDKRNDAIYAVTDRLGTRRLFTSSKDGTTWLSTSLRLHPIGDATPDVTGVACYLANGAVFNNRTLFDGVSVLERATISRFGRNGFEFSSYWTHVFTNEKMGTDPAKLRRELSDLLIEAVRRRISGDGQSLVGLSGGWDSTTILGILVRKVKVSNLSCYTYAYGEPTPGSDSHKACETANRLGCGHRIVQSYDGDLPGMIEANSRVGRGMTAFCEDVTVWEELHGDFSADARDILMVGEHCFGGVPYVNNRPMEILDDALASVAIHRFSDISLLAKAVPKDIYRTMRDGWLAELDSIVSQCSGCTSYNDYKDYLYISQRMRHVLCPWRHLIIGEHIAVRQPFLDNTIVDFMATVPAVLRINKTLFKQTAAEMFPDLFESLARVRGAYPDWRREYDAQRSSIEELGRGRSKLDEVLPPEAVSYLLEGNHKALRRQRWDRLVGKVAKRLGQRRRLGYERLGHTEMLQRVLVLRRVFQEHEGV